VLSMPAPPICTGLAEPMLVPGAMAATWAATVMKAPALAARLQSERGVLAATASLSKLLCRAGFTYKKTADGVGVRTR